MKNIKFILTALAVMCYCASMAQGPTRGNNGTQSNYISTAMHLTTYAGVVKAKDTLTNGDTGFAYIFVGQGFQQSFDLLTITLTGTVATTSNILYGYNNNGTALSASQAYTIGAAGSGFAITGNTTYCAGCVGAASTTVPGASKHYVWQVPLNNGALFDNYIIRTIQTGTATAIYTARVQTQY